MSSVKSKSNNTLLKSKTTKQTKQSKHSKQIKSKSKKIVRPHIIDKYCGFYKNDINGKPNKKLYMSCKINKYCRKYKCHDIDYKMIKEKQKHIGSNYNKIIFDKIKSSCPQKQKNLVNILQDEDEKKIIIKQKQCEKKALKQIYKDNNLEDIYKKSVECDNVICAKEQKIFNINLFRQKQTRLKKTKHNKNIKSHKKNNKKIKYDGTFDEINFEDEPDRELIERGD